MSRMIPPVKIHTCSGGVVAFDSKLSTLNRTALRGKTRSRRRPEVGTAGCTDSNAGTGSISAGLGAANCAC